MLSILVGHSYFLRFDAKQFDRAKPYPPLATLQVADQLREHGHAVAVFDAMLAEGPQDFEASLSAARPQLVLLYEDNYNFLTKMCLGKMRQACCEMVAHAKRSGMRVIVAGSDASDAPLPYLQAGADVVLRGEGLAALATLVERLDSGQLKDAVSWIDEVDGTVALADGALVHGKSGQVVTLHPANKAKHEEHPLQAPAAWDLVYMAGYRAMWREAHGYFSLNMAASKGCSFRCAWCAKPIWGNRYQQRAPEAVAAEMIHLKQQHAPDHIWFADDIFGFRTEWVERFADALEAAGGGVPFMIQTRADLITPAMAPALARAGCREVWLGAESGSQQVLDAMNKGTTVEEIRTARNRLGAEGIRVGFFIQLGYLGEGLDELMATRQLIETAKPDEIGVSVSYPLPGTAFHEQVSAQLGEKTHWDDSADLAMMFKGSFGTEFYRSFRDLLHAQVDLAKLKNKAGASERRALQQRWLDLLGSSRAHAQQQPAQRLGSLAGV